MLTLFGSCTVKPKGDALTHLITSLWVKHGDNPDGKDREWNKHHCRKWQDKDNAF